MRINNKILSLPPYISTSWKNIASIHCECRDNSVLLLIVGLNNGTKIEIPHLETPIVESIFTAHSKFMEQDLANTPPKNVPNLKPAPDLGAGSLATESLLGAPAGFPLLQIGAGGIENFGAILQHNPQQSDNPDLPKEILNKIASISKAVGIDDPALFPKPEPHCNCFHCQISRAIQSSGAEEEPAEAAVIAPEDEAVSDEDLKFRIWDVSQTAEKLYMVSNPLDSKEHYSVFLGEPIGCTCGEKNCEHIRAVLNS